MTSPADNNGTFRPLRILIVEDNPDGRETLRVLLELLGHKAQITGDGVEGLEKALTWRPDVALVDIGLPRLDGFQLARKLRSVFGGRIFLIAQTGYGQPEDREQGLAAGFDVYLVKPLILEDLCFWLAEAAKSTATAREEPSESSPSSARSSTPLNGGSAPSGPTTLSWVAWLT